MYFKTPSDIIAQMEKDELRGISYASKAKSKGKASPAVKGASKTTQIIVNPKGKALNIEDWLKKPEDSRAKINESEFMDLSSANGNNGDIFANSMEYDKVNVKKQTGQNLLNWRESVDEVTTNEYNDSGIQKQKQNVQESPNIESGMSNLISLFIVEKPSKHRDRKHKKDKKKKHKEGRHRDKSDIKDGSQEENNGTKKHKKDKKKKKKHKSGNNDS